MPMASRSNSARAARKPGPTSAKRAGGPGRRPGQEDWLIFCCRSSEKSLAAGGLGVTAVFLVAAAFGAAHLPANLPGDVVALLAFITLGATLTGVVCWNFAVGRLGVIIATLYLNLLPVIGMITAAAIGRTPTAMQLVGGGIVIVGLAQLQLRRLRALPKRYAGPPAPARGQ